ncbi:8515_t:CDS:1 [Ambispora leptoticha]|uniref:8515_t:CDS:1 n=1 Tax=Ambispora leptoticha TaxID=144679 RepID=A0A9N9A1X1_9GLOM|nr:8515_t:CDS:1 [Ambispora leptoticha]
MIETPITITKTILLIGQTGSGKSTIANVISNTNHFKESQYGVSETQDIQIESCMLQDENLELRIIDTIGINDTRFSEKVVLSKIAEAADMVKGGLNQIFFITNGRFTETEIQVYTLLRTVFFAEDIGKYTTIVRTKFPGFRNHSKCKEDEERMVAENENVAEIIRSCHKFIHVNNLTEEEELQLTSRIECRDILIKHLIHNCKDIYKPKNLDELNERIEDHMTFKKLMREEVYDIKEKLKQLEERAQKAQKSTDEARELEDKLRREFEKQLHEKEASMRMCNENIIKTMTDQIREKEKTVQDMEKKVQDMEKKVQEKCNIL